MQSGFLQASLFTSVVAFGAAAMAAGRGILFLIKGMESRGLEPAEIAEA